MSTPVVFDEGRSREIIARELNVPIERLTREQRFIHDLGADSLDCIELVMTFEEEYEAIGMEISDEEADKLDTVGALLDFLEEKIKNHR